MWYIYRAQVLCLAVPRLLEKSLSNAPALPISRTLCLRNILFVFCLDPVLFHLAATIFAEPCVHGKHRALRLGQLSRIALVPGLFANLLRHFLLLRYKVKLFRCFALTQAA